MTDSKEELMKALDNDNNSTIMKLTNKKIIEHKENIFNDMGLPENIKKDLMKTLINYRVCNDMCDLTEGNYIRWIPLKDLNNIYLTRGAFIVDVEIDTQIKILCKSIVNRHFRIIYDECILFQKITPEENVILSVLDYLDK